MASLPFIVAPRLQPREEIIGTEESGQIKIIRRGYLTAAEKAFTQSQEQTDSTRGIITLCRRIGTAEKMDMQKAYTLVSEVLQGDNSTEAHKTIASKYEDELLEVMSILGSQSTRQVLMQAFCMLLYRVDSEFPAEELQNLHPDLLEALVDLYTDEETRSVKRLEEALTDDSAPVVTQEADALSELEKK